MGIGPNNPRRLLELAEEGRAVAIGDPRVDRRRANALMAQVVLNELQGYADIEQMGGDGMPEAVAGVAPIETCAIAILGEQRLNLTLLERPSSATKERLLRPAPRNREETLQELRGRCEERLLRPRPTLQALDDDPSAVEVDVLPQHQRNFTDPQAIVIDNGEERSVAEILDRTKEGAEFELREIARKTLRWPEESRQRRDEMRK